MIVARRFSKRSYSRSFSNRALFYQNGEIDEKLKQNQPFGLRYGPGGRSSVSGITATVFGSTGFLGRYIMNELGSCGTRVYAPYRGDEFEVRHLKQMFDLGQLGLMPFSPRDRESVLESMQYSDVVINLIGKHYETKHLVPTRRSDGSLSRINYSFDDVHIKVPETIAELAKEAGVKCMIHVSALGADENSSCKWNRSKALGEAAVRSKFPEAIIVKPATIFGHEDRFLNWIADLSKKAGCFPLLNEGRTMLQPVHVNDVAKALMEIVYNYEAYEGRDFQLAGPAQYTLRELAEFVADVTLLDPLLFNVPVSAARFAGTVANQLMSPVLSPDMVEQMLTDVIAKDDPALLGFDELGLSTTTVDKVAFDYLARFRRGGHFRLVQGYHN